MDSKPPVEAITPAPAFPLTRYFLMTGLLTALIVPLVFSRFATRDLYEEIEQRGQQQALALADELNSKVQKALAQQRLDDASVPATLAEAESKSARESFEKALKSAVQKACQNPDPDSRVWDYLLWLDTHDRAVFSSKADEAGKTLHLARMFKAINSQPVITHFIRWGTPFERQDHFRRRMRKHRHRGPPFFGFSKSKRKGSQGRGPRRGPPPHDRPPEHHSSNAKVSAKPGKTPATPNTGLANAALASSQNPPNSDQESKPKASDLNSEAPKTRNTRAKGESKGDSSRRRDSRRGRESRRDPRREPHRSSRDRSQRRPKFVETIVHLHRLDAHGQKTKEIFATLIIDQEVARLIPEIESTAREFATYSGFGIIVLMLSLYLSIRKAERSLQDRSRELLTANTQLRELSQDLERQVEKRTEELVRSKSLASVGTLSAGVAHEVLNPTASIASCAEGLLRTLKNDGSISDPEVKEEFDEYLKIIRDEAFRVKDITQNLLDFSRRGGSRPTADVDLGEVLQATQMLVAHRLKNDDLEWQSDLGKDTLIVQGDGAELRQMALNLTVNAMDASKPGSAIVWRAEDRGSHLALICEDQGHGFSEADLERALEPFYTSKAIGQGTGLGLSIADSIARRHSGRIEISNRDDGPGARLTVLLSKKASEAQPENPLNTGL